MKETIWLLFLTNGRLNRRGFWIYVAGLIIIGMLFRAIFVSEQQNPIVGTLALVIGLITAYTQFAVLIKRFHDLGASGWWSLFWLVPGVNIAVLVYCGFFPGNAEANQFGNYRFLANA